MIGLSGADLTEMGCRPKKDCSKPGLKQARYFCGVPADWEVGSPARWFPRDASLPWEMFKTGNTFFASTGEGDDCFGKPKWNPPGIGATLARGLGRPSPEIESTPWVPRVIWSAPTSRPERWRGGEACQETSVAVAKWDHRLMGWEILRKAKKSLSS